MSDNEAKKGRYAQQIIKDGRIVSEIYADTQEELEQRRRAYHGTFAGLTFRDMPTTVKEALENAYDVGGRMYCEIPMEVVKELIRDAVRARLSSDIHVGVTLAGEDEYHVSARIDWRK